MAIEIPKKEPLNIVPFIDIMLVLLAMVLSVSTFIAKGEIPIALPESRSAQAPLKNSNEVLIQVTGEGTLHWNGDTWSAPRLQVFGGFFGYSSPWRARPCASSIQYVAKPHH